jgi:hypothetical protein
MGARYYGSAFGRFITTDPLYIELHRLLDPQSLSPRDLNSSGVLTEPMPVFWPESARTLDATSTSRSRVIERRLEMHSSST